MKDQPLIVPAAKIFSFKECLWFLDRGLDDCMHTVLESSVLKLVLINNKKVLLEISAAPEGVKVEVLKGTLPNEEPIVELIKDWFDLERDLTPFYKLLQSDNDLQHLKKNYYGLHIVGIPDFFEVLCWCIIGQQINLTF